METRSYIKKFTDAEKLERAKQIAKDRSVDFASAARIAESEPVLLEPNSFKVWQDLVEERKIATNQKYLSKEEYDSISEEARNLCVQIQKQYESQQENIEILKLQKLNNVSFSQASKLFLKQRRGN